MINNSILIFSLQVLNQSPIIISGIIVLIWALINIKPVYAYEDKTHWGLTAAAIGRLRGATPYSCLKEINKYLSNVENIDSWFSKSDQDKKRIIEDAGKTFSSWTAYISSIPPGSQGILWGSIAEDYLGDGGDIDPAIVQNHYHNLLSGRGLDDWEGAKDFGQIISDISLGNLARKFLAYNPSSATARAQTHWVQARKAYENGSIRDAYSQLGRVVHLLEDMTESAHTRNDNHLGAFGSLNFPEYNDHLYWTTYEKWCDSIGLPIEKDTKKNPHPFEVAVPFDQTERPNEDRLSHEQREELSKDPELFKRYQSELKSGKLHLDFMNYAIKRGWKVDINHDDDKNKDFYFKMAKGGRDLFSAVDKHNQNWREGHHSPETNEDNLEEKIADQWSIILRSPMIRDRWINRNKIQGYSSMREFLNAFQEEGYFINEQRGDYFSSPEVKAQVEQKWVEGRKLVEEYLREKHGVDPENFTIEDYMKKIDETKIEEEDEEPVYIPGEIKKFFPYLSNKFEKAFNKESIPSSWSYIWGQNANLHTLQLSKDELADAYSYVKNDDTKAYLDKLCLDTASKWLSEDTIPGNRTCPQTYPKLRDNLSENFDKTKRFIERGLIIDALDYIRDKNGQKITEEIVLEEMKKVANARTPEEKEESYSKYPKMSNTIFPKDNEKNLWELLYRRRYRITLDYAKEMAKDRFPVATECGAALIQAFYDSVNHVDIRKDGEEKDKQGDWRKNVIKIMKKPGEDDWSLDLWIENCGGVKEDIEITIGDIPEKWKVEVTKLEGCSNVTGKLVDRIWKGKVTEVESTPEDIADEGKVGSPWFFQREKTRRLYDNPYGTDPDRTRGAKITIKLTPPSEDD